jgi:hypothetical protein
MYSSDRRAGEKMITWLRTLSPPLRYLMYGVGVLLMFFVAIGVGATAAVVVGWQYGWVATGSAGTNTYEESKSETTGTARASEDTATVPSSDSKNSNDTAGKVSFIHRATEENSRGDYTYISDPSINGDPNAVVLVSDQKDVGSASYEHHIGVWYESAAQKWAIFNQDRAPVPAGATFEVEVPQASATFVHHADLLNTAGNYTYLDDQLTNGEPDAVVSVTQNWNPGGGGGVYNNHPIGAVYDAKLQKWAIYNRDGAPMPKGAAFNVAVPASGNEPAG